MKDNSKTEQRCPIGSFSYTIKSGDTLFLLARRFNTTVEDIMKLNPKIDPNNLQIGQVICIPRTSSPTPSCPNGFLYTIKSGDTLYELSQRFNVSVDAIMRANPGINPNNLQIGQVICIPQMAPPIPSCPNGFHYTIRPGDTLFSLSQRFNVSVDAIMRANPGINPNNLQVGQVICIPHMAPPVPSCPNGFLYTIRPGDTLYGLSQRFNVSVDAIMRANPGINPNNLQVGQIICIPQMSPPVPNCPNGFHYTIKPGDTLFSLSKRFDVSIEDIMRANPGIDPSNLQIGQVICIPKSKPPISCPGGKVYTIIPGDNIGSIALKFNVSVMDLMAGNPKIDWEMLKPGQKICILPHKNRGCPCPSGTKPYVILQSDVRPSMSVVVAIAEKFVVSVTDLMLSNPNFSPADFTVGIRICIPPSVEV